MPGSGRSSTSSSPEPRWHPPPLAQPGAARGTGCRRAATLACLPPAMTDDPPSPALLPAGLADLLPPEAEREAALVEALVEIFARHGYERVKPPLLEFEDSLFAGSGAALADQTFRLMDP